MASSLAVSIAGLHAEWSDRRLAEHLTGAVLPLFAKQHALPAWAAPVAIQIRKSSAVFKCVFGSKAFAIKILGPHRFDRYRTISEFNKLLDLRLKDPAQKSMAVPRPVSVIPDMAVIATEWVDGPTLEFFIKSAGQERRLAAFGAALRWLRKFHAIAEPQARKFRPRSVLKHFDVARARHRQHVPFADNRFQIAAEELQRLAQEFEGTSVPWPLLHYDANCRNFIFDGKRVFGFDFRNDVRGDPLQDYARLLVEADLQVPAAERVKSDWLIDKSLLSCMVKNLDKAEAGHLMPRLRIHLLSRGLLKYFGLIKLPPSEDKAELVERLLSVLEAVATREATLSPAAA
ncbi:MAG: phosphotransferase [Pseudomonadota bacterium]